MCYVSFQQFLRSNSSRNVESDLGNGASFCGSHSGKRLRWNSEVSRNLAETIWFKIYFQRWTTLLVSPKEQFMYEFTCTYCYLCRLNISTNVWHFWLRWRILWREIQENQTFIGYKTLNSGRLQFTTFNQTFKSVISTLRHIVFKIRRLHGFIDISLLVHHLDRTKECFIL